MKKAKFEKTFDRFQRIDKKYYKIAKEYEGRLGKYITILSLADRVYSDYIKITKSDDQGMCTCVTSGRRRMWNSPNMQNGHYCKRGNMKHRFDDDNCYPQSREDNIFLDGNYPRYTMVMAEKLGSIEAAVALFEDRDSIHIHDSDLIKRTKQRYAKIQKRKKQLLTLSRK